MDSTKSAAGGPDVTFITICYRNPDDLRATLVSLASLDTVLYEKIVVDGSPDNSCADVVAEFFDVRHLHGPDSGKYDAMNKGIAAARGSSVCFMNSGDQLADPRSFEHIVRENREILSTTLIYGDCIKLIADEHIYVAAPALTINDLRIGVLPSHQSVLIPTEYHRGHTYDSTMHFAADTKFLKDALVKIPRKYVAAPIALFAQGGASSSPGSWKGLVDQFNELCDAHELNRVEQVKTALLLIRRKLYHLIFGEVALQRQQARRLRRSIDS